METTASGFIYLRIGNPMKIVRHTPIVSKAINDETIIDIPFIISALSERIKADCRVGWYVEYNAAAIVETAVAI